jgi:hypothetical protein
MKVTGNIKRNNGSKEEFTKERKGKARENGKRKGRKKNV